MLVEYLGCYYTVHNTDRRERTVEVSPIDMDWHKFRIKITDCGIISTGIEKMILKGESSESILEFERKEKAENELSEKEKRKKIEENIKYYKEILSNDKYNIELRGDKYFYIVLEDAVKSLSVDINIIKDGIDVERILFPICENITREYNLSKLKAIMGYVDSNADKIKLLLENVYTSLGEAKKYADDELVDGKYLEFVKETIVLMKDLKDKKYEIKNDVSNNMVDIFLNIFKK